MKFYIRDLFLVTMIAAVCVAWWQDHRRQAELARDARSQLCDEYRATRANGRREPLPLSDY
jgi:hypothetical protein